MVHACGALHDYGDGQAEIAAIATNPVYSHLSMGRKILSYLDREGGEDGHDPRLRPYHADSDWFEQFGFVEADLESLPAKKQQTYNHARKSRIFALELKDRKPIKS